MNRCVRHYMLLPVVAYRKANGQSEPNDNIIDVSQNDWHGFCICPNGKAVDDAEASHAGTLLVLPSVTDRSAPFREALLQVTIIALANVAL